MKDKIEEFTRYIESKVNNGDIEPIIEDGLFIGFKVDEEYRFAITEYGLAFNGFDHIARILKSKIKR